MRIKAKQTAPAKVEMYNLEQYITEDGKKRKLSTLAYNIPYGMAKGLKNKAESQRQLPGTHYEINKNVR